MTEMRTFPDGFMWGAATAAHQIEGGNLASDWWALEHMGLPQIQEPSGDAADSYHRFDEDIRLLAESGLTTYRFSIEWARIEPEEGHISKAALAHYQRMIDACVKHGITPAITLHHFTSPRWFTMSGGWFDPRYAERFERYVEAVLPLAAQSPYVFTINEPNIYAMMVALFAAAANPDAQALNLNAGALPEPNPSATQALIAVHKRAVEQLRGVGVKAGWTVAPQQYYGEGVSALDIAQYAQNRETVFLEAARGDDFVGVQAYTRNKLGADGPLPVDEGAETTQTGWEYYPPAIAEAVATAASVCPGLPIFITENGIATADDRRRIDYTREALENVHQQIAQGLPVIGYLHWSLLDNYEWGSYAPTFGLIAFDKQTFARTPKPSLAWLGNVARHNGF